MFKRIINFNRWLQGGCPVMCFAHTAPAAPGEGGIAPAPAQSQPGAGEGAPAAPPAGSPAPIVPPAPGTPGAPAPAAAQKAVDSPWKPGASETYQAWLKAEGLSLDGLPQDRGPAAVYSQMIAQLTTEQRAALPLVFKTQLDKRVASVLKNRGIDTELPSKFEAANRENQELKAQLEGLKNKNNEATLPEGFHDWSEDAKKSYMALNSQISGLLNDFKSFKAPMEAAAEEAAMTAELEEAQSVSPYTSPSLLAAVIAANKDLPANERIDTMEAAMHAQAEQINMVENALGQGDPAYWELVMKSLPKALESKVPQVQRIIQLALEAARTMQLQNGQGGEFNLGGGAPPAPLTGQQPGESWAEYQQRNS